MTKRIGSLCAGYGGLDLAVSQVFSDTELAWYAEIEESASKIMEKRFPGVPNIGNLVGFDWATTEEIDILTAGFPCQPVSNAGKRKGTDDSRWLWPEVAEAIRVLRPEFVFLENVASITNRGMGDVLGSLSRLGFDAEWGTFRASDVGAPHQRNRWFCVAYPSRS